MKQIAKQFKLFHKFLAAAGIVVFAFLLLGIISYIGLTYQQHAMDDIAENKFKNLIRISTLSKDILKLHNELGRIIRWTELGFIAREESESALSGLVKQVEDIRHIRLGSVVPEGSIDEKAIIRILDRYSEWINGIKEILWIDDEVANIYLGSMDETLEELFATVTEMEWAYELEIHDSLAVWQKRFKQTVIIFDLIFFLSVTILFVISCCCGKYILSHMNKLIGMIGRVTEHNESVDIVKDVPGDELESLSNYISHMASRLEYYSDNLQSMVEERTEKLAKANLQLQIEISDRKRIESELMESQKRLSDLVDFLPDAMFAIDRDGQVIAWNRALEEMTGVVAKDMVGKNNFEYSLPVHDCRRPMAIDMIWDSHPELEQQYGIFERVNNTVTVQGWVSIPGKEPRYLWGKAGPIYDTNGRLIAAIELIRDITATRIAHDALHESESQKRAILDASLDLIRYVDTDFQTIWANKTAKQKWNLPDPISAKELCYRGIFRKDAPCDNCPILKAGKSGKMEQAELSYPMPECPEKTIILDCYVVPLKNNAGEVVNFIQIAKDITDRKEAEKALRESEEKFRNIFVQSPIGIELYDAEGRLVDINHTGMRLFGIQDINEINKLPIFEYFNFSQEAKSKMLRHETVRLEMAYDFDEVRKHRRYRTEKNGTAVLDLLISPLGLKKEESFNGWLVLYQDITDRKQAEKHIQSLTRRLLKAREAERQRFARDLHDSVAQDLSSLRIGFETLFDDQPCVSPAVLNRVKEMSGLLQDTIREVREISYDMLPPSLENFGLVESIYQHCHDVSEKTGLDIDVSVAGLDGFRLEFEIEINLYRVIQEALNNIRKHAHARNAVIKLVASYPNIILRMEDDGRGFDLREHIDFGIEDKRIGLRSMEERIALLGGEFHIASQPGRGTKIFIQVPLPQIYEPDSYVPEV